MLPDDIMKTNKKEKQAKIMHQKVRGAVAVVVVVKYCTGVRWKVVPNNNCMNVTWAGRRHVPTHRYGRSHEYIVASAT